MDLGRRSRDGLHATDSGRCVQDIRTATQRPGGRPRAVARCCVPTGIGQRSGLTRRGQGSDVGRAWPPPGRRHTTSPGAGTARPVCGESRARGFHGRAAPEGQGVVVSSSAAISLALHSRSRYSRRSGVGPGPNSRPPRRSGKPAASRRAFTQSGPRPNRAPTSARLSPCWYRSTMSCRSACVTSRTGGRDSCHPCRRSAA
jgi:hypothetical protein